MGDIFCAVCGEPWDSYEIFYEFEEFERKQFRSGRGCPSCKGEGQRNLPDFKEFLRTATEELDDFDIVEVEL